ncbi:MAG: HAMP domain-containing protein [Methylococcaceae bacterium]|nr:MAG: HAMP domain-containing protein [Methylococcaceae bacterium]
MAPRTLSLRKKSVLALVTTCLLSALFSGVIGKQAIDAIQHYLGTSLTRNLTLLNRERILAPVQRELALSMRLAKSQAVRQWLLDEANTTKKNLAFREAESFRQDFIDHSYFLISALSNRYYFNDGKSAFSNQPRYRLLPGAAKDAWFFSTLQNTDVLNINVDVDVSLGLTKIWFNVIVKDGERKIGLAGSGLDLSTFLRDFASQAEPGITPVVIDRNGAIQAHPDGTLIAFNSATKAPTQDKSIFGLLQNAQGAARARAALDDAVKSPGTALLFEADFQQKPQILAVSYIPELKWHVLTAVDLATVRLFDNREWGIAILAACALLLSVALGFGFAIDRLIIKPLFKLTLSARAIAAGNYQVTLPPPQNDEIGDLTGAFAAMVKTVQRHTEELEHTVQQRTLELMRANREMAAAHRQIGDSIAYAVLIQQAILPQQAMAATLDEQCFVLWLPRDSVGGDFR